jgi:hypothetical protein
MWKKIKKVPKIWWLLLLVFLTGSIGIFYNYAIGNSDEGQILNITLKIFRDFSLSGNYSIQPPVSILLYLPFAGLMVAGYLIFGIGDLVQLKELVIVDVYKFLPYFRFANVIFGLITIYFFYKLCLLVFRRERSALIGAYLLATSLLFVENIHIAVAWTQQTMFIVIALYYYLRLLEKKEISAVDYAISALLVVLNFGVETVGLAVIVPFFLIYWRKRKEGAARNEVFGLLLFFSVIILGTCLLIYISPSAFQMYFKFFLRALNHGFSSNIYGQGITDRIFSFPKILLSFEPLLFVLAFLGAIVAFRKEKFYFVFFGSYFLVYYVALGPILGGVLEKRAVPVLPVLAIFAAFFIEFILNKYRSVRTRKILYAALLIFMINPLIFGRLLLGKGSLIKAREWMLKNTPAKSSILDTCPLGLNENQAALNFIKEKTPNFLTTKRTYLLDHPDILNSSKNYFVIVEKGVAKNIGRDKFQYLVLCYYTDEEGKISEEGKWAPADYFWDWKKTKIYDSLAGRPQFPTILVGLMVNYSNWEKSGFFSLLDIPYYGPNIEIYALENNK